VSSKFYQNAPRVCQNKNKKAPKSLELEKLTHLKINIVKDLLTSKHSMTQKLALQTSSKHNITLESNNIELECKNIIHAPIK
jgi:hypothetical protein